MVKHLVFTAAATVGAASASGATFTTGFESADNAGYTPGASIVGVDGWSELAGTGDFSVVSSPVASGDQAIVVERTGGGSAARVGRFFDAVTGDVRIEVSMAWERDSSQTGSNWAYFGDDDVAGNQILSDSAVNIGFGRASGTADPNSVAYNDGGTAVYVAPVVEGAYYRFTADVDFDTQTYDLTITGGGLDLFIEGVEFRGSNVTQISSVLLQSGNTGTRLWVDDMSVVPEPAAISMLAALALIAPRRNRNRK